MFWSVRLYKLEMIDIGHEGLLVAIVLRTLPCFILALFVPLFDLPERGEWKAPRPG